MKIAVIDIVSHKKYSKYLSSILTGIVPQTICVWLERQNHKVFYDIITGYEKLPNKLIDDVDVVFISSFTMSAYLSYSISNYYRQKGVITILGGPHARSYPEDCKKYFDYVIGLISEKQIINLVKDINRNRIGVYLTEDKHPEHFCRLEARWKYITKTNTSKFFPIAIPMISSTGCPNACNFCIDSNFKYTKHNIHDIITDLLFLKRENQKINVIWYDPNFGENLDEFLRYLDWYYIDNISHLCELSLSKLNENICKKLKKHKFIGVGPGIESWSSYNYKTLKRRYNNKLDKVKDVSNQLNMITKYIPIVQANIMFGLDKDNNEEHFELTKELITRSPTSYINLQTFTLFGQSTPLSKKYLNQNRVIKNFPYNLMDGFSATNVILNYDPIEFYFNYSNLSKFSRSAKVIFKRAFMSNSIASKTLTLLRRFSKDRGTYKHYKKLSNLIKDDKIVSNYLTGNSDVIPLIFLEQIKKELGNMFYYLPHEVLSGYRGNDGYTKMVK